MIIKIKVDNIFIGDTGLKTCLPAGMTEFPP
jgi:hypothetical protein